jgi:hypothetical protein
MFIFWDEESPQTSLTLCISITLVVVLLWYICKQEYNTSCDRRIMDHYQSHIRMGDYPVRSLSKKQGIFETGRTYGTMLEKHKKVIDPERGVLAEHSLGDKLHNNVKKMEDSLTLDPFANLKSEENGKQLLHRNLSTADYDGPQLEGMAAPITSFEDDALSRQLVKQQEVYGNQGFSNSEADQLATMNL